MIIKNWKPFDFKAYKIETLEMESQCLKGNPLKDPTLRLHPVMSPKNSTDETELPMVFILSGFGGNGSNYISPRSFERSFAQTIDSISLKIDLQARFVFVDAWTSCGGSQFINSKGVGRYEDFIVKELFKELCGHYRVSSTAIFGGSSGGYGALHLSSKYPEKFNYAVVLAPDSYFEYSLMPEILSALPVIQKLGGIKKVYTLMRRGDEAVVKNFNLLNVLAMGLCYSPHQTKIIDFPFDWPTGISRKKILKKWLNHDPIYFLKSRKINLKKIKRIYLGAGREDQFYLQYGAEQIYKILKESGAKCDFYPFDGDHIDLSKRRPHALEWLKKKL